MKHLIKSIIVASALLVIFTAAFFVLINTRATRTDETVVFSACEPTDVTAVSVKNESGGFEIYVEDGGFVVDDIPSEYVDLEAFTEFMVRSGAVSALKCVNEHPDDPALYGLDAPQASAAVSYADGRNLDIEIGISDPVSGNYYARVNGDKKVYLITADLAGGFLAPKKAYIDHAVTPKLTVTSPLSALRDVAILRHGQTQPVVIQAVTGASEEVARDAKSFGAVTHLVRGKGTYELDQTYGIEILGSILDIRAQDIVAYNITDADYEKYGFGDPAVQAQFFMSDGTEYLLSLVESEGGMLAHISGKNIVFKIDRPAFADVEPGRLMLRWFLSPLLLDISSVTVEYGGEVHEIAYRRVSNSEQFATLDGQDLPVDDFQAFYRLLTSASSDGEYLDDAAPSGEPQMRITYHYTDAEKADDVMELYPGAPRRLYVKVNGACEFDIRQNYMTRVMQGIESLKNGSKVEEDW